MSAKIVIYTAIFGNYEGLIPQPEFPGVEYVCFTDMAVHCKPWKIIEVTPEFDNPRLNARKFKILVHQYLKEYDVSIYIDGNFLMLQNPIKLVKEKFQGETVLAYFDHKNTDDSRDCVYQEYEALLELKEKKGYFKDDPKAMESLIVFLKKKNYPERNQLISSGVLLRKHKDVELQKLMEDWWYLVKNYTNRDQLSFNYVLRTNNFKN